MSTPFERYQKLALTESLSKIYRYPIACKELSFILREAFHQFPKNLQTLIFQDTLFAFGLIPQYVVFLSQFSSISSFYLQFLFFYPNSKYLINLGILFLYSYYNNMRLCFVKALNM
jgi:hypothetical protein